MCVEKRSKTLKDAADVQDWMAGWFCFEHMRVALTHEGCFVVFSIRFDLRLLSIINV